MSFADIAFQKLTEGKQMFGRYAYYDKGADEIMDVTELEKELKKLPVEEVGEELTKLSEMEDTGPLMSALLSGLDTWEHFDALLDAFPELGEHY